MKYQHRLALGEDTSMTWHKMILLCTCDLQFTVVEVCFGSFASSTWVAHLQRFPARRPKFPMLLAAIASLTFVHTGVLYPSVVVQSAKNSDAMELGPLVMFVAHCASAKGCSFFKHSLHAKHGLGMHLQALRTEA
jgi:hypothetical protein